MRSRYLAFALLAAVSGAVARGEEHYGATPYDIVEPVAYEPTAQDDVPPGVAAQALGGPSCTAGGGCDDGCCEACCDDCTILERLGINMGCCRPRGVFVNAEYTMWWTKRRTTPILVTTSPAGTPIADTGVLPGATPLFGGEVGEDLGHGGRLTLGKWLDPYQTTAITARMTTFRGDDGEFNGASDGTTNLAIPFFDTLFDAPDAYLVGFSPDGVTPFSAGTVNALDRLDLFAVEVYGQFLLYEEVGTRVDMFGGYHMLRLDNSLSLETNLTSLNAAIITPVGTQIFTQDTFEGRNEFHGGTLGFTTTLDFDRWFFVASGKLSVGNMNQEIIIDGNSRITTPGPTIDIRDEGLFALGTNQGVRSRDKVTYIPEANLKLGYRLRPNVAVTMGYDFMYISSVVMGGDQLNPNVNLTQTNGGPLIGPADPQFLGFRETDFWAQGLNFGLEVAF